MSFTSLMSRSYCIIWNLRHSRMYALAWKGWSSGSLLRINLREFRAVFWATLSSLILTWLLGLQSYVIDMSREYCNVYRIDGRTDVAAFLISSEYFFFPSPSPPPPSLFLSLSLSFSYFLCPQWATRARLRPFKNMEPVWPEWLLWKSSGLPDGLSPTRSGPPEKKRNTKESSF